MSTVAGVLLAAGEGSRLGQPKALTVFRGERLVDVGVRLLRDAGTEPVIAVTGAADVEMLGVVTVHNPEWRSGMGTSLAAGLTAVPGDCAAAVIALVDQPLVGPQAIQRLMAAHRRDGAGVAVAAYGGKPRNPVLLAREHWPEVVALAAGDTGARPFLKAHPDLVTLVECGDTGDPADVDTPEDLARLEALAGVTRR